MRVMIVEDEPASAEYIAAILARYVPEAEICCTAENGEDALVQMPTARPDVVVTDVAMPRMDGLALTAQLKKRWPQIRVIIVSGYQEFEYARAALRHGVADYLLKPVNPQELACCLRAVSCEEKPALSSAQSAENSKAETSFTPLESYVAAHLAQPLTLPRLCRECGVSQTTANRIFRKYTGMSFLEYVTARRIEKAQAILRENPETLIKTVALTCGFSDPLYFSKVFKNIAGCAPTEYANRPD